MWFRANVVVTTTLTEMLFVPDVLLLTVLLYLAISAATGRSAPVPTSGIGQC